MQDNNLPTDFNMTGQSDQSDQSYVDNYQPPQDQLVTQPFSVPQSPQSDPAPQNPPADDLSQIDQSMQSMADANDQSQSLEAQNIFDLLGVSESSTDEEKERFLDELQEVIWEDFIENDVNLLLTEDEFSGLQKIKEKGNTPEVQEEILGFLENLIPDLEEIMLDKALELKEDMVYERIAGMKEFHSGNQGNLDRIAQAEKLLTEDKWADAASILNKIKA